MHQQKSLQRINELMSRFTAQVKGARALNHTDINRIAEDVLVPLLGVVLGYEHLCNLNTSEEQNFPAVDLGDFQAKVSIQVTSTSDSAKIQSTLEKFVEHHLDDKFDHLRFYLLTEKQKSYAGKEWDAIIDGKFRFDKTRDILDSEELMRAISGLDLSGFQKVENILEGAFGDGRPPLIAEKRAEPTEDVFLNLLEIEFPERLFVARLSTEALGTEVASKSGRRGKRRFVREGSQGAKISAFLKAKSEDFPRDWVCHAGKLLTFQPIDEENHPLRMAIEPDSVEAIAPDEFFADPDQERVFKHLVDKCLSESLYARGVVWQPDEKCYIFLRSENGEKKRREKWWGKREAKRTVCEVTENTNGDGGIWYCKHLSFTTRYHRFGDCWFLAIKPEWFFSFDGFRKDRNGFSKVQFLKKKEKNQHVANHVRFIVRFLQTQPESTLFHEAKIYPHLRFGELLILEKSPYLDDKSWVSGESTEDIKELKDPEAPAPGDESGKE